MGELKKRNTYLLKTALFVAVSAILSLLPAVIIGKGMLLLTDDFTYQQQVFNIFNVNLIRSGGLFKYSSLIDLGSDTAVSMAFYNLFSPFTFFIALFPGWISPYLTYPMLAIKYVVAGVGASLLTKRFVKDENLAILGGILYSFCGLQTINLLFPFHDETALFPFLILGAELLVKERKPGVFAAFVFLSAITNYYLFFGEVLFLVLWFIFRVLLEKEFTSKEKVKAFGLVLLEGIIGTLLACFILVPVLLSIIENPRLSNTSFEIRYSLKQYLTILQSYFLPSDVMGMRNYLFQKGCSSCGLCLPFVSMAFVISYVKDNLKKSSAWFGIACVVISLVPVLNGAFSLFNVNYYARWFYMMALLFSVLSCKALDNDNIKSLKVGSLINLSLTGITVALEIVAGVMLIKNWRLAEGEDINWKLLALYAVFGITGSTYLFIVTQMKSKERMVKTIILGATIMAILTTTMAATRYSLGTGVTEDNKNSEGRIGTETSKFLLNGMKELKEIVKDDSFYRVKFDYYEEGLAYFANSFDNASMVTNLPSVSSFISTVSGGIFEFYDILGLPRNVTTNKGDKDISLTLSYFLSCKYFLTENKDFEEEGISLVGEITASSDKTIYVYEVDSLPMGFVYDSYVTKEEIESLDGIYCRFSAITSAVVLEDEDAEKLSSILQKATDLQDKTEELKDRAGNSFTWDDNGFTSVISSEKTALAFYTVPYSKGFKAYVNGEEREVFDATGMCAVLVDEGENEVEFTYETPGLSLGTILSGIGILLLAGEITICIFFRKKH